MFTSINLRSDSELPTKQNVNFLVALIEMFEGTLSFAEDLFARVLEESL
jgi:hypothetical protein